MGWLVAIVVLLLIVVSPGFRAVLGCLAVLAVLAVGVLYVLAERDAKTREQEEASARQRISSTELVLEDATLGPSSVSTYQLRARARNLNNTYAIRSIRLMITLRDCATVAEHACDTVGQATEALSIDIPPRQVRDIDSSIHFSPAPTIRGRMSWSFVIQEIMAAPTAPDQADLWTFPDPSLSTVRQGDVTKYDLGDGFYGLRVFDQGRWVARVDIPERFDDPREAVKLAILKALRVSNGAQYDRAEVCNLEIRVLSPSSVVGCPVRNGVTASAQLVWQTDRGTPAALIVLNYAEQGR